MNDVELSPGTYVVAVSGGVDSVVLLDVVSQQPGVKVIVGHFDHGIRGDSGSDREFVEGLAKKYHAPFAYEEGRLGAQASEAMARQARYDFLHQLRLTHKAKAIVTAHHQDDLLETAILNLLRGTRRRGLSSLRSTALIKRPLLNTSKQTLITYAKDHQLHWREDSTNRDITYLRNYIRHKLLVAFSDTDRTQLLTILKRAQTLNDKIDTWVSTALKTNMKNETIDRYWFIQLPHAVAREIMAAWLRQHGVTLDHLKLERAVIAGKTYQAAKRIDLNGTYALQINKHNLALIARDR